MYCCVRHRPLSSPLSSPSFNRLDLYIQVPTFRLRGRYLIEDRTVLHAAADPLLLKAPLPESSGAQQVADLVLLVVGEPAAVARRLARPAAVFELDLLRRGRLLPGVVANVLRRLLPSSGVPVLVVKLILEVILEIGS